MAKLHGRRLSNRTVESLCADHRDTVFWDGELAGFGVRVYPSGAKVYVVQTRAGGRSRRVTVGLHGVLTAPQARRRAALVIARLKAGEEDPLPRRVKPSGDAALTVAELAERFLREHVAVRCKEWTMAAYRGAIRRWIVPSLGRLPVRSVEHEHIADLHYRLRGIPYRANQVLAILNKMFSLAEVWGLRQDGSHPCRSIRRYREHHRERFLSEEEFRRLGHVLDQVEAEAGEMRNGVAVKSAVAALRLLMLTGCRRNEILTLKWSDVDFVASELRLRDSKTGPRAVPISSTALSVLSRLPRVPGNPWVVAGARPGGHLSNLHEHWHRIRSRASLDDVRIHDLRHSFASRALALGESLPTIARLLGHGQVSTTARYAHLARDAVKTSASRVSDSIAEDIRVRGSE
ncbi:MAG: tyrosine-type recombinase/integrase [Immundisolibacterales bacterium]|nr:tyrosine-type recombinase/integrase [Immundisolibacterales bacterium]